MSTITVTRTIDAPLPRAFQTISDIRKFSKAGGTGWDSVFSVEETGDEHTRLTLRMEARPYKLLAKLTTPLFKGMIRKALEKDMDAVKAWCEPQE